MPACLPLLLTCSPGGFKGSICLYRVVDGDNCCRITHRLGTTVQVLYDLNPSFKGAGILPRRTICLDYTTMLPIQNDGLCQCSNTNYPPTLYGNDYGTPNKAVCNCPAASGVRDPLTAG